MYLEISYHSNRVLNHVHYFRTRSELSDFIDEVYENTADYWISSNMAVWIEWPGF